MQEEGRCAEDRSEASYSNDCFWRFRRPWKSTEVFGGLRMFLKVPGEAEKGGTAPPTRQHWPFAAPPVAEWRPSQRPPAAIANSVYTSHPSERQPSQALSGWRATARTRSRGACHLVVL